MYAWFLSLISFLIFLLIQGGSLSLQIIALQSLGDPFEHEVLCPGNRMTGSFVSDHVFNLTKKELSAKEISVLEKGLGFVPNPSNINEADLRRDLREFSRKMRCKWHFRNEVPQSNEEISQFKVKSQRNPPKSHPALEAFLKKTEKDIFSLIPEREKDYNLTRDEYLAMRSLENDRNVIIKPADQGSSIVVWDRLDYLAEAEKQLSDSNTYKEVKLSEKDQIKLVEKSKSMFEGLKKITVITEIEKNYFKFNFKKATNVGKLYLLPKIHKRLSNKPGRPVISNCGTPTEKVSEFLDHCLQPLMKEAKSYIKNTADFLDKLKDLGEVPEGAILVTADLVGLYPSIPHTEGLEVLRKQYDRFLHKKAPTEDIIKMADFVLKNNFFEFNSKFFQKISGNAIGTKFAPPICLYFYGLH